MAAFMTALAAQLQALITPLIGPVGVLLVTGGIAVAGIILLFDRIQFEVFMRILKGGLLILGAGAIAAGMKAF